MGLSALGIRSTGKPLVRGLRSNTWRAEGNEAGLRCGLTSEDTFHELLCLERKRSERSRKPFLLMLLGVQSLLQNGKTGRLLQKTISAVSACTRETDLAGWQEAGMVIGVMFTELGDTERTALVQAIRSKVLSALEVNLGPEQAKTIEISFCFFPEEQKTRKPGPPADRRLYPDLSPKREPRRISLAVKRVIDVVGSLIALLLFSPFFLLIALATKLTSKGPIFFRQERVGKHGVPFKCFKFRTMYEGNDPKIHQEYVSRLIAGRTDEAEAGNGNGNGNGVFKITEDPRITPVGRLVRKTSMDELPQLFNVLRGEMSLVGPRPPIPYELESYDLWHLRRVLEVQPGITGLWQVSGRSRVKFDDMVRLDLRYARAWSLWLDLKILVRTPLAVFSGDGAY